MNRGGTLPDSKNVLGKLLMEYRDDALKQRKIVPLAFEDGEFYDASYVPDKDSVCFVNHELYID